MKKHIPNIITCMNLTCGTAAVILSLWGYLPAAFLFMLAASCFDFCDGAAARLLNAYSDKGKELDSLADMVSFGLLPAVMLFTWYYKTNTDYPSVLAFVALLIVPFSALRLAKFNIDSRQTTDFLGVSTPTVALLSGSLVCYGAICMKAGVSSAVVSILCTHWFIPVYAVIMSLLLVSEIPMFSMKHKELSFKKFPAETLFIVMTSPTIVAAFRVSQVNDFKAIIGLSVTFMFTLYLLLNFIRIPFLIQKKEE